MENQRRPDPTGHHPGARDGIVAAALLSWCRRPRVQANRTVATIGFFTMIWVTVFAWQMPDRALFLHNVALMFAVTHGAWHILVYRGLRRLCAHEVAGAEEALCAYVDPRRINHLDVAAAWLAFAVGARIVSWMAAGGLPAP